MTPAGDPAPAGSAWRKSSRSNDGGNCVQAAVGRGLVTVRDSADLGGPVLKFTPGQWTAFSGTLKQHAAAGTP